MPVPVHATAGMDHPPRGGGEVPQAALTGPLLLRVDQFLRGGEEVGFDVSKVSGVEPANQTRQLVA
jgi:hypothetical protein